MTGIVRGLVSKEGELSLPDQDFDPSDPYSFHLAVAHFHRIQARVLPALGSVLPAVHDEEWSNHEQALCPGE